MPAHFDGPDGEPVAIETYVHLPSTHVSAARAAGLVASELREAVIDADWIRRTPKWERHSGWAISCLGLEGCKLTTGETSSGIGVPMRRSIAARNGMDHRNRLPVRGSTNS